MADSALRILREPGLRERMGAAARERAVRLFEPDVVVGQYEAIYRDVVMKTR